MKRLYTLRRRLLAPLVYLAAIILLLEEWLWDLGARLMAALARVLPLPRLARWIASLGPVAALCLFLLPGLLLFPVKILALLAIARGHAFTGVCTILLAKIAGAAAVARIYALTLPALLRLRWFAWCLERFLALKDRWIARLRATRAWREVSALAAAARAWRQSLWLRLHPAPHARNGNRLLRVLRRYISQWRARRREP
ncbi:hypothetical protein LJR289_000201 [Pseudoduganella sp. LjRoot289]|uniref:hypothetical protein n=1 Tax=Pseudoduganella sp. LjRoot289 TaxID=3342314 RepID=UPI003ED009BF